MLSTNFKVMYSTLRNQESLVRVKAPVLQLQSRKEKYVLGRNPYSRLESFYRDKLNKDLGIDKKIIRSQKIFFPYLGLNRWSEKKVVVEKIGSIDFPEFINLLPKVYMKNRHLHPQVKIFKWQKNPIKLRIEEGSTMKILQSTLGINTDIRANQTDREKFNLAWTPKMYRIVNELYREDFDYFGYDMKVRP